MPNGGGDRASLYEPWPAAIGLSGCRATARRAIRRGSAQAGAPYLPFASRTTPEEDTPAPPPHRDLHSFPTRRSSDLPAAIGLSGCRATARRAIRRGSAQAGAPYLLVLRAQHRVPRLLSAARQGGPGPAFRDGRATR